MSPSYVIINTSKRNRGYSMNILKGILPLTLESEITIKPPRCKLDNCNWAAKVDGLCVNHKPKLKTMNTNRTGIKGISILRSGFYRVDLMFPRKDRVHIGQYKTLKQAKIALSILKEFRDDCRCV